VNSACYGLAKDEKKKKEEKKYYCKTAIVVDKLRFH